MNVIRAQLELSSKCNFKCVTCRHGYSDYGSNMPDDICDMLCEDVIPFIKILEIQGTGESLLYPRTGEIIQKAAKHGAEITLITNGSLLKEPLLSLLVKTRVQLVISLDGPNSTVFSMHRPIGNFDNIINNIAKLQEIRTQNGCEGFTLVVNMVLTQLNCTDIPEMISLLSNLGVDHLFVSEVRECMPDKNTWDKLNLASVNSTSEFSSMINECKLLARQKNIGFSFNANKMTNRIQKRICEAPWKHIFVAADGDVSVCCELPLVFGNLKEQSLEDILHGSKLFQFQSDMLNGNYDKHCLNCCLSWGLPYSE